jgi:hypothetical protein
VGTRERREGTPTPGVTRGLPLPAGIPALEHGSAMASIMANDPGCQSVGEEFGRPRPNFLAEELEAGARQQAAARAEAAKKGKDR